jgi:hypothetical protein
MATVLVIAYEHDLFHERHFLLSACFARWRELGHEVVVREGVHDLPPADLAILHVDRTVVPDEYAALLARYPRVVNARSLDAGKRVVSRQLVDAFDPYRGPVILKTNANAGGGPEQLHIEVARRRGAPLPPPVRFLSGRYPIYHSISRVPTSFRLDPGLVLERFLPERVEGGYAVRHWLFLGDRERCTRTVGPHPVVTGADVTERTLVVVPDELRAERARLALDYGKLDFVMHEGRAVLLDANRAPTAGGAFSEPVLAAMRDLADGLACFLV